MQFFLLTLPVPVPSIGNPWWRHQIETFSALLAFCVGTSLITGKFPTQRPVTRSFDVFSDLCLNKQLSQQWIYLWSDMTSPSLWRHCNAEFSHHPAHRVSRWQSIARPISRHHWGTLVMAYLLTGRAILPRSQSASTGEVGQPWPPASRLASGLVYRHNSIFVSAFKAAHDDPQENLPFWASALWSRYYTSK